MTYKIEVRDKVTGLLLIKANTWNEVWEFQKSYPHAIIVRRRF